MYLQIKNLLFLECSCSKQIKTLFQTHFGRINELVIISIFEDHILILKKTAPGKQVQLSKSLNNQGSTVEACIVLTK